MIPKLVAWDEQAKLFELSMEVQQTARRLANQRITVDELDDIMATFSNHIINTNHIRLAIKDAENEDAQ